MTKTTMHPLPMEKIKLRRKQFWMKYNVHTIKEKKHIFLSPSVVMLKFPERNVLFVTSQLGLLFLFSYFHITTKIILVGQYFSAIKGNISYIIYISISKRLTVNRWQSCQLLRKKLLVKFCETWLNCKMSSMFHSCLPITPKLALFPLDQRDLKEIHWWD